MKGSTALEEAINLWKHKEERFRKIFSFDMSENRWLQAEKLRYFQAVSLRFRNVGNPSEKLILLGLKQECRHLEKYIYPNAFVRRFMQLLVNPIRNIVKTFGARMRQNNNEVAIKGQLGKMGLNNVADQVVTKMREGRSEFVIPISKNISENRNLDIDLCFKQDESGIYELVSHDLKIKSEQQTGQPFSLEGSKGSNFDPEELYNLIEGRPVQSNGKWYMLDLNDKDTNGNYKLKEICSDNSYDISKSLKDLQVSEMRSQKKSKILAQLSKGCQVLVTVKGKKYKVEANPQFRGIKLFDLASNQISVSDLKEAKSAKKKVVQNAQNENKSAARRGRKSA